MEEDQEKRMKSEMELNHMQQQQQQDPLMYDLMANNNVGCFQIPHDQSMFVNDHHHQNWVPDSMFCHTSYYQSKHIFTRRSTTPQVPIYLDHPSQLMCQIEELEHFPFSPVSGLGWSPDHQSNGMGWVSQFSGGKF